MVPTTGQMKMKPNHRAANISDSRFEGLRPSLRTIFTPSTMNITSKNIGNASTSSPAIRVSAKSSHTTISCFESQLLYTAAITTENTARSSTSMKHSTPLQRLLGSRSITAPKIIRRVRVAPDIISSI